MEDLIQIKNTKEKGRGIFAIRDISKDEYITEFKGPVVEIENLEVFPPEVVDHLFNIGTHTYIMAMEPAVRTNHSCEPNAGIKEDVFLVAMRDIKKDEEVTFDYSTIIADEWTLDCLCGTKSCRSKIGKFKYLSDEIKQKYYDYTPEWIKKP
jgi:SET domain-containing protein